jgi:aspartate kinase
VCDELKKLVVKFGGSLVASKGGIRRIADLVLEARSGGSDVVPVVSALGGVTDLLIRAAKNAPHWNEKKIDRTIQGLKLMHLEAVRGTSLDEAARFALLQQLDGMLEKLRYTLLGVSILGELSPRSRDAIVSFGERMAAPLVASEIESRGVRASSMTGGEAGIVTDHSFGEAVPDLRATKKAVGKALLPKLGSGEVPVVAGFIGRSPKGEITTLGRGGSDYTATLLAAALGAKEVWIWTDVDGILTGDPRVVRNPITVKQLSYAEAEELAFFGAKNMHPLALGPARLNHIPVRILNGFKPDSQGTLITDQQRRSEGVVKVVAAVRNVGLLTVAGETLQGRPGIAARVFSVLASAKVNILMISQSVSEANIGMVVKRPSLRPAGEALRREFRREGIVASVESDPDISVVAAVGAGMRGEPGVAAKVFGAVASKGINVKMIAQGSSELNISFVVDDADSDEAVRALHELVVEPGGSPAR